MKNKDSNIPTSIPTSTSNRSPLKPTPDPNLKPSTLVDSTPEQRALARDEKLAELKAKGYKGAELDGYLQSWFSDTEYYKGLEATINARFEMHVGDRFTELGREGSGR